MGRWILGAIILLFVGLVYGLMTAESRMTDMQSNIKADLITAGYSWADVEMSGNEARVSGTAPSLAEQQNAIKVASEAYCSACKDKHRWHTVEDATDVIEMAALPTQSPYSFSARKTENGTVVLNGYVPSEDIRGTILRNAVDIFGNNNVSDDRLVLASGAPDGRWTEVITLYMRKLAKLDTGRLLVEDFEGSLQGKSASRDVQQELYGLMGTATPAGYNFVGNVAVPEVPVQVFGQSGSQTICQGLLDDLRDGRKINFSPSEAVIRGDRNFDLLAELASAANQCPKFRIAINGYTSSDGEAAMNQKLSEDRANAVLFYLSEQGGIELARLAARGLGSDNPIASNATPEGREQNRRIEFILSRAE
ncbi:MAG: OmpA family protein [Litorimonas sp.]